MLDPLTAIGLASAIVQFVDQGTKLVHDAKEIYDSTFDATEANRSLEVIVNNMKRLYSTLSAENLSLQSDAELALCRIAKECESLSKDIFDILQKVKPKKSNSLFSSSSAAFKSKWYAAKIADLQAKLDNYQGQLAVSLNVVKSAETKASLDTLLLAAMDDATKLEQLQKRLKHLQREITVSSFSSQAQKELQELLGISEHASELISQQCILKRLAFQEMHGRLDAVPSHHTETFEWLLDETSPSGNADGHNSIRELFVNWLSSGKGIFHISGKLGSGKSTLMKYICCAARTKAELKKWAGHRKLISVNFFFWRPGTELQKSLAGLFRSLLHDILKECPELTPKVFPELCEQVKSLPWQVQTDLTLPITEIQIAFTQLIKNRQLYQDRCFCLFIDGLDEYVGTHEEDPLYMTKLLCDWTNSVPECVKICVSSREDNVFLNAFSDQPRIRLQDLTRADMERYIREKLAHIDNENSLKSLVKSITNNANGIFLWVALAVKSIRKRLEDGYEISEIEKELDSLPHDLEDLFKHVLKSIDKSARKKVYQTFTMIPKLEQYRLKLTLLHYSFLDNYANDTEFAMKKSLPNYEPHLVHRKLNGDCRGLLEVTEDEIAFTHRSIPEFLYREDIQAEMKPYLKCFCPETALSQLLLAEIRFGKKDLKIKASGHYQGALLYALLDMRLEVKADHEPYYFQEYLGSVTLEGQARGPDEDKGMFWKIMVNPTGFQRIGTGSGRHETLFYISAFLGDHEYVAWKTRMSSDIADSSFEVGRLLAWAIQGGVLYQRVGCFEILESFLKQQQVPNAYIFDKSSNIFVLGGLRVTFWQSFIAYALLWWRHEYSYSTRKRFGEVVEAFLRYDADPHIWASVQRPQSTNSGDGYRTSLILKLGRERHRLVQPSYRTNSIIDAINSKGGGELSLRDIVNHWQLDNAATILQLLDRNDELQEQSGQQENHTPDFAGLEPGNEKHTTAAVHLEEQTVSETPPFSDLLALQPWFKYRGRELFIIVSSILLAVFSRQLLNLIH